MTTGAMPSFPERLRSGERLLGVVATLATPSAVEILVHAGFDWLWLDMEHGPLDVSTALAMVQARGKCPCSCGCRRTIACGSSGCSISGATA